MKEQETKKSKKKILFYYLMLAVCLLVIAAVTVTVIFAVRRPSEPGLSIDNGSQTDGNDDNDDNGGNENGDDNDTADDDDDNPVSTDATFALPVDNAVVTTSYDFAYNVTLDLYKVHQGMDFEGSAGDKVYAVLDGTVEKIVVNDVLDGSYIVLSHDGGVTTTYKFIEIREGLKAGDHVSRGEEIGTIAEACGSEMKQGEHLHFEVAVNGSNADPDLYLEILEK